MAKAGQALTELSFRMPNAENRKGEEPDKRDQNGAHLQIEGKICEQKPERERERVKRSAVFKHGRADNKIQTLWLKVEQVKVNGRMRSCPRENRGRPTPLIGCLVFFKSCVFSFSFLVRK